MCRTGFTYCPRKREMGSEVVWQLKLWEILCKSKIIPAKAAHSGLELEKIYVVATSK